VTHFGPVPGKFVTESRRVETTFHCPACKSDHVTYRDWESDCGGYEDTCYKCEACGKIWWVEGPDA
jgi:transposase-like protein